MDVEPLLWDDGPLKKGMTAAEANNWVQDLARDFNGNLIRIVPSVPDPATLSWLLRKASLDVVHTRRMVKVAELTAVADTPRWGKAIIASDSAFATRSWLADIIREQGQEGTE